MTKRALFSLFLAAFFLFCSSAYAETLPQNAVIVRPSKAEVTIAAGEESSVLFRVFNSTGEPLHVDVSHEDVAANVQVSAVDDPIRLLGDEAGANSLKDVLSMTQSSFEILPGREVGVPILLRIPKNAEPSGMYGSVIFRFSKQTASGETAANVSLEGRIAALLYVRIAGDAHEEGSLAAFGLFNNAKTTRSPTLDEPLRMQVAYQNTGTVHLNPYGRITLRSMFGNTHTLPIDPWAVLPNATRMREFNMTEPLGAGLYTAHLELNRGYGDIIDEHTVTFWVLPTTKVAFMWLVGTMIILWFIRRSFRLSKHALRI